jgi:hypothetical protein
MSIDVDSQPAIRRSLIGIGLILMMIASGNAGATLITSAGDTALVGALVEDFDSYSPFYFASQSFPSGADGFTVTSLSGDLHMDDEYCGSFGTAGSCLDTLNSGGVGNDDFDVVFAGPGVSAFGFDLSALDTDWTVETYDINDILLGSYVIASQSPALSDFDRRGYFGATESQPIQYFTVRSGGNDRALIDNFAFVPVPEPGAGLLAGLGLVGLASVGRRTRNSSQNGIRA